MGDTGLYRDQWEGLDSLDRFYKQAGPQGAVEFEINARSEDEKQVLSVGGHLQGGSINVGLETIHPEIGYTNILVESLSVRDSVGALVARYEMEHMADWDTTDCGNRWGDLGVDVYCRVIVTIDVPVKGEYSIDVVAWISGYQTEEQEALQVNYGSGLPCRKTTTVKVTRGTGTCGLPVSATLLRHAPKTVCSGWQIG